jgi:hypothetical protein
MLGRHARPCESFLVCIEGSELCFSWSLRKTWMDAFCTFVIDLVPSNAGKPLRFKDFRSVL